MHRLPSGGPAAQNDARLSNAAVEQAFRPAMPVLPAGIPRGTPGTDADVAT